MKSPRLFCVQFCGVVVRRSRSLFHRMFLALCSWPSIDLPYSLPYLLGFTHDSLPCLGLSHPGAQFFAPILYRPSAHHLSSVLLHRHSFLFASVSLPFLSLYSFIIVCSSPFDHIVSLSLYFRHSFGPHSNISILSSLFVSRHFSSHSQRCHFSITVFTTDSPQNASLQSHCRQFLVPFSPAVFLHHSVFCIYCLVFVCLNVSAFDCLLAFSSSPLFFLSFLGAILSTSNVHCPFFVSTSLSPDPPFISLVRLRMFFAIFFWF